MQEKIASIARNDLLKMMSKNLVETMARHGIDNPETRQVIWLWLADAVSLNPRTARLTWRLLKGPPNALDKREKLSSMVHCLRPMPPVIRAMMREADMNPLFGDVALLVCQNLILD